MSSKILSGAGIGVVGVWVDSVLMPKRKKKKKKRKIMQRTDIPLGWAIVTCVPIKMLYAAEEHAGKSQAGRWPSTSSSTDMAFMP